MLTTRVEEHMRQLPFVETQLIPFDFNVKEANG
jgi:hypothetical protein